MTDYFCQRVCLPSSTESSVSLDALAVCELDGSETLVLCLLTALIFAVFVFVYRSQQSQSTTLITKQLQTKRIVTPPNPNADTSPTLDTTYTLHHFNSSMPRTITLPNGSFDGQWVILMNTGMGAVSLKCRFKDGHNTDQPGVLLGYGSSCHFVWLDPYWSDATVGFSII